MIILGCLGLDISLYNESFSDGEVETLACISQCGDGVDLGLISCDCAGVVVDTGVFDGVGSDRGEETLSEEDQDRFSTRIGLEVFS